MNDIQQCIRKWVWSLIFIRIPKNASTSIYHHLGENNLIKKREEDFNKALSNQVYKKWFSPTHAKPDEISLVLKNMVHDYISFAVVRNPWDRAVSMYHFAKKHDLGKLYGVSSDIEFNDFCQLMLDKYEEKDKNFIAIHDQCSWLEGMFEPNFILRFENLNEDFSNMLDICQIKHINKNLPHENSTERKPYKEYYNDQSIKIIEKIFERDIDKFKYSY